MIEKHGAVSSLSIHPLAGIEGKFSDRDGTPRWERLPVGINVIVAAIFRGAPLLGRSTPAAFGILGQDTRGVRCIP